MENIDDIIKRMVLHMKYDRNKTLSENKILLEKKDCVPLDATPNLGPDGGVGKTGDLRFKDYPELGTWGDGRCRCWDNKKCFKFETSCCNQNPKVKISIDPSEVESTFIKQEDLTNSDDSYIETIDLAGRKFYLPPGTTNIGYWDINKLKIQTYMYSISGIDSQTPRVRKYCESQTPKKSPYDSPNQAKKLVDTGEEPTDQLAQQEDFKIRVEECMLKAVNILLKSLTQGGVSNFTYNGINYGWCYKNGDEDVYNMYWNGGYYGGEKIVGDDGEDDCPGTMWKNITPKEVEEKVAKGEVKVKSTQNVITTDKETEGTASEAGLYSPNTTTPELSQTTGNETITSSAEKIILPLKK
jgi:hypothetical protein